MKRLTSRWIALAGIAVMTALLLLPIPSAWTAIVSVPLVILLITGIRPPARWGGWAAVAMVPYMCVSLAEAIVDPASRPMHASLVVCAVVVFFAAMHFVRATGASLRR